MRPNVLSVLPLLALAACLTPFPASRFVDDPSDDYDGDGVTESEGDCDDLHPTVRPGADELCDEVDNDCDGRADEDPLDPRTWFRDSDGDGFGNDALVVTGCSPGTGYVAEGGDCDDASATVFPGAPETCTAFDDNCDGDLTVPPDALLPSWYLDRDQDGYGTSAGSVQQCEGPPGYAPRDGDCDDRDAERRPTAFERCNDQDDDCDGLVDQDDPDAVIDLVWYRDDDGDGWGRDDTTLEACDTPTGYAASGGDCNDATADESPDAVEQCDGLDQDCNGLVDDGTTVDVYLDVDQDGHGNPDLPLAACPGEYPSFDHDGDGVAEDVYVAAGDDCDDLDARVSPSAGERCNGTDDDCDGVADNGTPVEGPVWARDADGDGYGATSTTRIACAAPTGFVADTSDCDDLRGGVHPGAAETCRTTYDDDCDGGANDPDALACITFFLDGDADGYGQHASARCQCTAEVTTSYTAREGGDCDDALTTTNPGAFESCGTPGVDDNCNGDVNDADADGCANLFYDVDGDGYGLTADALCACDAEGYYSAALPDDCDDLTPAVNPGATEVCNDGTDDDCDGRADDATALDATAWRRDADADGYGSTTYPSVTDCEAPTGFVAVGGDCNDGRDNVNPGRSETCATTYDDDCDGSDNDPGATGCVNRWTDVDDDGYGTGASTCTCADDGTTRARQAGDCDDVTASIHTGATERCDTVGLDDDCDGTADEADALGCTDYFQDLDGDGFGTLTTPGRCLCAPDGAYTASQIRDCDDTDARVNPDAANCGLVGTVSASDAAAVTTGGQPYGTDRSGSGTASEPSYLVPSYVRGSITAVDLNLDGTSDVVIGHASYDNGIYTNAGAVMAWSGPVTGLLNLNVPTDANSNYVSTSPNTYTGAIVSAGYQSSGSSAQIIAFSLGSRSFYLLERGTGSTLLPAYQSPVTERWDGGVFAPDLTSDASDDLLLQDEYGTLALLPGGGLSPSTIATYRQSYRWMRPALADLTGDGNRDILTNSYYSDALELYEGRAGTIPNASYSIRLALRASSFHVIAAAGDVNLDGYEDLLVGDYYAASNYGRTYLLLGPLTTSTTLGSAATVIQGTRPYQQVGAEVASAGDVDGDGYADLLVGTATADVGSTLWYGPLPAGTVDIGDADALFPHAILGVAGVGDTNADGFDDFFVGTPTSAYTSAYLYLGQPR